MQNGLRMTKRDKIYFASDQHFGIPDTQSSRKREMIFISWLDEIRKDAECIFLLGRHWLIEKIKRCSATDRFGFTIKR